MSAYTEGQAIEVAGYPFVRTVFNGHEFDGEGGCIPFQEEGWRPGCEFEECDNYGERYAVAGGVGQMILTVVSTHKPGRFAERVFYTRQWRDPDGKVFGDAKKLRVMSSSAFSRLCRGYRHSFEVVE